MAGVLKKGYMGVKTKGLLVSGYKLKFVMLQRNAQKGSKLVIVKETETATENVEYISLDGMWTVQDKISRNSKRYPFELVICSDVVMTFSCFSVTEREDWTESFRTLNRLSMHSPPVPMADMYPVTLERSSLSSTEVGVWGPCLLCIQDASIVLYSEDGYSKLHHWSAGVVKRMTLEGDQLVLLASRAGGDTVMEFHFNADKETASSVVTAWNMVVIQSVANDPEKLNSISSFLQSQGQGGAGNGRSSSRGSTRGLLRPTRTKNKSPADSKVKRSSSLTERSVHSISRRSTSPEMLSLNRLSSLSQDSYSINIATNKQGSDEEELAPPVPPRAPRKHLGISKEEPDYSYIRDDEVGQSETGGSQGGGYGVVERQLDDLLRDILEDNSSKTKTQHKIIPNSRELQFIPRSKTIGHAGGVNYLMKAKEFGDQHGGGKEADDYLEPVPSKNPLPTVPMRRGNHAHSRSLPSAHYGLEMSEQHHKPQSPSKRFSQEADQPRYKQSWPLNTTKPPSPPLPPRPSHTTTTTATTTDKTSPVLSSKDDISPYAQTSNFWIELGGRPKSGTDSTLSNPTAPPIPPRSPIKPPRDRYHSASSTTSSNSSLNNHRCRRCNGMKRSVGKTTSLDPQHAKTHQADSNGDIQRGSLPDLHHSSPIPENGLGQQRRQGDSGSSSPHSSYDTDVHTSCHAVASSRGDSKHSYRRLSTGEPLRAHTGEPKPTSPTSPPPYLQVVENQVPSTSGIGGDQALDSTLEMLNSVVRDLEELQVPSKQRTRPTDLDVALKQIQQVHNDLTLAKQEPRMPLNLHRSASVTKSPPHSSSSSSNITRQQKSSIHSSGPSRSSGVVSSGVVSSGVVSSSGVSSTHHRSSSQGQQFLNGITHTATSPQVPPRSAVSLKQQMLQSNHHHHQQQQQQQQQHRPIRHQMSSPAISTNRYTDIVPSSSSSVHRTSFPRNIGAVAGGSGSTVFFHHLRDIKRTQC